METPLPVYRYETLPSTNELALQLAISDRSFPFAVRALTQSAGHGQEDRPFLSPPGGLYLTAVLPFHPLVTLGAAVAVCEAIRSLGGGTAQIKWINDVLIGGRKCCGILTKTSTSLPGRCLVGIGLNVCPSLEEFPPSWKVTSLAAQGAGCTPDEAEKEVLRSLLAWLERPEEEILEAYRVGCVTLGQTVDGGTAEAIGSQGELIIRQADGGLCTRRSLLCPPGR